MESSEPTPTGRASHQMLSSKLNLHFFLGYCKKDSLFGFNLDMYNFKASWPSFTLSVWYIRANSYVLGTSAIPPGWFLVASLWAIVVWLRSVGSTSNLKLVFFQGPMTPSTSSTKEEDDMEPHVTEMRLKEGCSR